MNTTASWPLFATTAPVDNRIDLIGQNFNNKMMAQSNNTSNEFTQKPDDLSTRLNKQQIQDSFNHIPIKPNINNNINNNNKNNINNNNNTNSNNDSNNANEEILNLHVDGSRDEDLDDEDNDSMIDSMGDEDSLPSPDAMYATSYLSNDSIDRNGTKEEMDSEGQSVGRQTPMGPLAQLQNALERHSGMLGMSLTDFPQSNGNNPSVFGFGSPGIGTPFNSDSDITGELYRCHLCSYSGTSKCQFNAHMNTHFDHKCPYCDYTSRTEGRLKRHIRDFHSEIPPESWAGNRVLKENSEKDGDESIDATDATVNGSGGKNRKYKCKQCQFVATCKQEFWDHSKEHIKSEKLLTCPKCNFVTEYKHHLEYHLRNHFGSKPFKCAKCNYSCVNKSMLNSHMKSHSNIYQYRCADCSYATKYCHSLKLHLRKYQHKPATVLNLDGTPNPYPVIDVYGTRRGPRPKKSKDMKNSHNSQKSPQNESSLPQTQLLSSPLSPNMINTTPIPPLIPTSISMGLPFMYPPNPALLHSGLLGPQGLPQIPHLPNPIPHQLYDSQSMGDKSPNSSDSMGKQSNQSLHSVLKMKCNFCDFTTDSRELFGRHLLLHVSAENQDICRIYGMSPTPEALQQNAIISELAARQTSESRRLLEQIAINPSFINTLLGMPKPEHLMAMDWHSTRNAMEEQLAEEQISVKNDNDQRPESAPVRPNSKSSISPLPRARSSPTDRFESYERDNQSKKVKPSNASETTPLDLSSNKSSSPPLNQPLEAKFAILSQHLTQSTDSSLLSQMFRQTEDKKREEDKDRRSPKKVVPSQEAQPTEQQQSRAQRRKGRASKLNVNRIKMNDQSLKSDDLNEDTSEETVDSLHEEPDVDNIITKINNATSLLQEILIDMYTLKNEAYH